MIILNSYTDEEGDELYYLTDETGAPLEFTNGGEMFCYSVKAHAEASKAELEAAL